MASADAVVKAVLDQLDGSQVEGYTINGQNVVVPGFANVSPATKETPVSVEVAVRFGSGAGVEVGQTASGRWTGALWFRIKEKLGGGPGRCQATKSALRTRYESSTLVVEQYSDFLEFEQLIEDFEGNENHEYQIIGRIPFERDRRAA